MDFASASDPLEFSGEAGRFESAGSMEVFSAPGDPYKVLPHRPLFRPSAEAISLLDRFTGAERWDSIGTVEGWRKLSNTSALRNEIEDAPFCRRTGLPQKQRLACAGKSIRRTSPPTLGTGPSNRPTLMDHGAEVPLDALPDCALEDSDEGQRQAVCDVICTVIAWAGFAASVATKVAAFVLMAVVGGVVGLIGLLTHYL